MDLTNAESSVYNRSRFYYIYQMESILLVFLGAFFLTVVLTMLYMVYLTLFTVADEMYLHLFQKPIYIHFYIRKKRLDDQQQAMLRKEFPFYRRLAAKHQRYFEHRVAKYIKTHQFIGKGGFVMNERAKLLIAGTAVMLTFGMRKYLFELLKRIIVYPDIYESTLTGAQHKGEFNPNLGTIVFSWKHFEEGLQSNNDNLNLGLHEFAHLLHFHSKKGQDISAILFKRMCERLYRTIAIPENRQKIIDSKYFRVYAYTNAFEFLAVLIEHYFETPDQFRAEFPELYQQLSAMLNHSHN